MGNGDINIQVLNKINGIYNPDKQHIFCNWKKVHSNQNVINHIFLISEIKICVTVTIIGFIFNSVNFIQSDRTSYDVSMTSSKALRFSNKYANSEDYIINFRKGCTELYTMPLFIFVKVVIFRITLHWLQFNWYTGTLDFTDKRIYWPDL